MSKTTLEKLRKIAQKRNQPKRNSNRFWKPSDGENVLRFLPAKNGDVFFKEFGEHWIDRKRYVCPKLTQGDACPICEAVNDLYNEDTEDSKALARQYKARRQHYANVIVKGLEEEGPKVFKFGIKLANKIVDDCVEEDIDISDPDHGIDYRVIRKKQDGFPNYDSSRPQKDSKNRKFSAEQIEEWVEQSDDLHEWVDNQVQPYSEIEAEFTGVETDAPEVETQEFDEDALLKEMDEKVA